MGDSLMGPPSLFHRSLHVNEETGGWHVDMHTSPEQCAEAYCPKGWLLAYPGNSPRDYVDFDTGELTDYAGHVDAMQRRATRRQAAPQFIVRYRGFTMYRCDECREDYLSIESARDCRDSHQQQRASETGNDSGPGEIGIDASGVTSAPTLGAVEASGGAQASRRGTGPSSSAEGEQGSISGGSPLAAPRGDAGSTPASSTAHAWRIIDTLLPHLEAKLARVTGHPIEWRFDHLRAALDVLRSDHVVPAQAALHWCGVCENGRFGGLCRTCSRYWLSEGEELHLDIAT